MEWYDDRTDIISVKVEELFIAKDRKLTGYVDGLIFLENQRIEIWDWKSGNIKSKNEMKKEMAYYHILVQEFYPDYKIVKWGMFFTNEGEEVSDFPEMKYVERAKGMILKADSIIELEEFDSKPGFQCNWCGFAQGICEVYK